jgi:hypothetical protein
MTTITMTTTVPIPPRPGHGPGIHRAAGHACDRNLRLSELAQAFIQGTPADFPGLTTPARIRRRPSGWAVAIGRNHVDVTSDQAGRVVHRHFCHTWQGSAEPHIQAALGRSARLGKSRLQVHVQADGGASGTGADLDQITGLLDNPRPTAAPGRDRIPA